jgi:hypothetical protein
MASSSHGVRDVSWARTVPTQAKPKIVQMIRS